MSSESHALKNLKVFSWLRALYNWVMGWADHPSGVKALCFFSLIESIIFPIPVDPLLVAMGAARPKRSLWFATLGATFSVLGAGGGYLIGFLFWEQFGEFFTQNKNFQGNFDMAVQMFHDNAFWSMVLAGFTFLPFKVFTVSAGVAKVSLVPFFLGCIVGRSLRFYLIGGLLYYFGPTIRVFIEKHFEKITIIGTLAVIIGLILYKVF